MARLTPSSPVQNLSGKFSWKEKIIYRTRNGRTHAYVMQNPYKGELAESRKEAINLFREATLLCKAEMNDPARLDYWQAEYAKHQKRAASRSPLSAVKTYHTLRGFIIASLSASLKATSRP